MSLMDGLTLVASLRQIQYGGCVIIYSWGLDATEVERYRSLGTDAIVSKATRSSALVDALPAAIRRPPGRY